MQSDGTRNLARAAALLLGIGLVWWLQQQIDVSFADLQTWIRRQGALAPVAFIFACVAATLLHAPLLVVVAVGGIVFGKVEGMLFSWFGVVLGAATAFLIARYVLRAAVQRYIGSRFRQFQTLDDHFVRNGFLTVLFLRLVLFMSPPLNWLVGTTGIPFSHYLAGSALGLIPGVVLTVSFADELAAADSWRDVVTFEVGALAALVIGFLGVSSYYARRRLFPAPGLDPAPD